MKVFSELGASIDRIWKEQSYDISVFPDIAAAQLKRSQVLTIVTQQDVIDWLVRTDSPVLQRYRDFGQPPVNVYMGNHFHIEILFWLDASPAIHQHAFPGAFGVLSGGSVQSEYRFEPRTVYSKELIVGKLEYVSSELLRQGDVRPISVGDGLIHSLFHLERPSLSVVVRTAAQEDFQPQYHYIRPSLAVDPFFKPEPFMTQLRLLDVLRQTNSPPFWQTARDMVERADSWRLFKILSLAYFKYQQTPQWQELLAFATAKHGGIVPDLVLCLREQEREIKLVALREKIHDPLHRFFLALLLNVPDQEAIFDLLRQKFSKSNPSELVVTWIKELSESKSLGLQFNPISIRILKYAMLGETFKKASLGLQKEFSLPQTAQTEKGLHDLWNELHDAQLLRPLLHRREDVPLKVLKSNAVA